MRAQVELASGESLKSGIIPFAFQTSPRQTAPFLSEPAAPAFLQAMLIMLVVGATLIRTGASHRVHGR
jgi:hypothetical protein